MEKLLKTEIQRIIDVIEDLQYHKNFDAYLTELKNYENLSYPEIKYYLEQILKEYDNVDDEYLWKQENKRIKNALSILQNIEIQKIEKNKQNEPLKLFWKSFKIWVDENLPSMNILNEYYVSYDNWNGGTYYLNINLANEFTKYYGLEYDGRYEKDQITENDLKLYLELFYAQFVKDRYSFTKEINNYFNRFRLPYKLSLGKLTKHGYKTSEQNLQIIDWSMLESKILWSEDKILGKELLDKHTALNYITDSLQYLLSLIDGQDNTKKTLDQKCAILVNSDEQSKIYSVIKNEVKEIQKIVNEYFDIRHNEYINKAKENRESLKDLRFIEYLYNRINSLLMILKSVYSQIYAKKTDTDISDDELPF